MTSTLTHRPAGSLDLAFLPRMNQQLIEDERHRNPMTQPDFERRMRGMLEGGYTVTLFESDGIRVIPALGGGRRAGCRMSVMEGCEDYERYERQGGGRREAE